MSNRDYMAKPISTLSSIPKTPYLGPRLRALFELIEQYQTSSEPYHFLWDCCCDHGYLGIKLLHKGLCQHLHFNDQVPHLIEDLKSRLSRYPSVFFKSNVTASIGDAGQLRLDSEHRHLMILAGVGGEHLVTILKQLVAAHKGQTIDFLFCPSTTQFDLREYLTSQNFSVLTEFLVTERDRDYEVIHVRLNPPEVHQSVSLTGQFWQEDNEVHLRYLQRTIDHYRRRTQGKQQQEAQRVLSIYLALWQNLTGSAYF